ncbi:17-beta-hydroxysteroid dehydrogenase 13-like [Portunus trituberculatus]|uniref:17-beta-hydroxysteroid dehydrogenase 13-like n=1 Tax=Portunus trituberculatus TaxID=210409 RepID=UPI001E1CF319|nr:17-beta-hydroxysteroid dehydrogenase 13-like [Portunus trituberculatus]
MADAQEVMMVVARLLLWLVATVYFFLESLVLCLVPRSYRRKDIKGNIVLVTGGGSGIGRLMCLKLAAKGAVVVTWDVSEAGNGETVQQVQAAGGQCHAYTVDLCDRQAVYAAATRLKQEVGNVDILVNNAGVVTGKSLMNSPDDSIQRTFDVNVLAHFWTTKAFMGHMLARNKGHIVNIASMAGKIVCTGLVDYCSSKHAAVGFHEALQTELKMMGKYGVKTTCVCPGIISTGMFQGAGSKFFPTLKPDWVAEEVVDAILMNTSTLYLPNYMWLMPLQIMLFPQKSMDMLGNILEMQDFMKNFVGRSKTN